MLPISSKVLVPSPSTGEGQDGGAAHVIELLNFGTPTLIPVEGKEKNVSDKSQIGKHNREE
jgi:hypothetical protein